LVFGLSVLLLARVAAVLNPFGSEQGAFQLLLYVGAVALAIIVVVLVVRAL
jgi:hypothetical protein